MMDIKLKIFTLNCWGIPLISKNRKPRMLAIANALSSNHYDIVCLQEVWSDSDYNFIKDIVKNELPYCHYFYSGVLGSGICVFSKYPFQEVFFHQWTLNGYVHKLHHGDWFGGKGVGLCRLMINEYSVNIYSAHLHAEYDRSSDEYLAHRVLQAYDTAQFIRLTSSNADLIVLAGDLNTESGNLAYRILMTATGLVDSYLEAGVKANNFFSTNESSTNSYTDQKLIKEQFIGKRIDYIMYRPSSLVKVSLDDYKHPLPNKVPDCEFSYSDHEAVSATIGLHRTDKLELYNTDYAYKSVLMESMNVCDEAMSRLSYHKRLYWFLTAFLFSMLFFTVGMNAPFNFIKIYHAIRVVVTGISCFTLVMATLWNSIEYNAVLAGKLNMEVNLKQLLQDEKSK